MFRHGDISTETDRGPFIFTVVALVGSLTAALTILVFGGGNALAIAAGVMLLIVAIAAGITLIGLVGDYAYIDNGILYMHYIFRMRSIPLKDIIKVKQEDNVYCVYGKGNVRAGTINAMATGIDQIVHELDMNGVRFE